MLYRSRFYILLLMLGCAISAAAEPTDWAALPVLAPPNVAAPLSLPMSVTPYGGIDPNYAALAAYQQQQQYQQYQQQLYQQQLQQQQQYQQQILMTALIEREADRIAAEDAAAGADAQQSSNAWSMGNLAPVKVSSPLLDSLWVGAGYMSPFSATDQPDRGVGCPLQLQSWIDRPYYTGAFVGWMGGTPLVKGLIDQNSGGSFGLILGKNYSHYWGFEGRLHFASLGEKLTAEGQLLPNAALIEGQANQITMLDASAHYYPLGNSRWRPFFKWGIGVAGESFVGTNGARRTHTAAMMPIGMGLKYWWNEQFALNTDLIDNVIFRTDGIATQHNIAFTFGLTYAFGSNKMKRPTAYWPYTPSGKR